MKGDVKLIATLNMLLADELTAISQYMVHSEMCDNWGFERLHKKVEERAFQEMKHAEKLIARIIFLEGTPHVDKLNRMSIGADVARQLSNDLKAEVGRWPRTTTRSTWPIRSGTPPPATCSRRSSATRTPTSTGWRPSTIRSSR